MGSVTTFSADQWLADAIKATTAEDVINLIRALPDVPSKQLPMVVCLTGCLNRTTRWPLGSFARHQRWLNANGGGHTAAQVGLCNTKGELI